MPTNSIRSLYSSILTVCLLTCLPSTQAAEPAFTLTNTFHLGNNVVTNWPEAAQKPLGNRVVIPFKAANADSFRTIGITARDVENRWLITLNGAKLDHLKPAKPRGPQLYRIPDGALQTGLNQLVIDGGKTGDDITVGPFEFYAQSFTELRKLTPLTLSVTDSGSGNPVPARLSIRDQNGKKVEIFSAPSDLVAIRPGLLYVNGAPVVIELSPGTYSLQAARGMEWSMAEQTITVTNAPLRVPLEILRVVDTKGFIASDTHLHTLTYSGHGDASIEERVLTLAGDGVEFAVATDHNHHTDYGPIQRRLNLTYHYTSVTGNEVSTANGHFNGFPLNPTTPIPNSKQSDWVKLVADIRSKGAKVVVLNHPRWPDAARNPFTRFGVNRASGERAAGTQFHFDAMELVNSTGLQKLPMYLFEDWFALLNHGEQISAVGTSDAHSVGEPVGQGRTYIRSSTDDPARLDVDEICTAIIKGKSSVSFGIFTDVQVNGTHTMGDLVTNLAGKIEVKLRVAAPAWVTPRTAKVFMNGYLVTERKLEATSNLPFDQMLDFSIPAPAQDAWLVCVVLGDGVKHPVWSTMQDYTLAATNPVWLDASGDGKYQSPRETATALIPATSGMNEWKELISKHSPAIAIQIASLVRQRANPQDQASFDAWLRTQAKQRPEFGEFLRYLPENDKK